MQKFSNLSIRAKVLQIILGGMLLTVSLSLITFISYDYHVSKQDALKDISMQSELAANSIVNHLASNNTIKAKEGVDQIGLHASTVSACLYAADNTLITATNHRPTVFRCTETWPNTNIKDRLSIVHTIKLIEHNTQVYGSLLVVSDLHQLQLKLKNWLILTGTLLLFSFFVAFIMTWRMHKTIVEPALQIKTTMDNVRETNDLSLRTPSGNTDEIGQLSVAFNELLNQMESDGESLSIMYRELVNKSTEAEANAIALEAKSEYIKQMMSNAAHDLRQPLQAMSIFIDALQMFELDAQPKSIINKLSLAKNNLNQMFNDIISLSRLEDFDSREESKSIHLGELFEKLHFEFEAIANKKHIDLKTYIPNFSVISAPTTLERIIRNLVSNAIRYTDKGGVLLGARRRKNSVIIEVWDTGCGIPRQSQKRIFNRYDQISKHQNGRLEGYGLGLAIVDHFVKTIGCKITLTSQENKGSCFKIHIPVQQPQHSSSQKNTTTTTSEPSPSAAHNTNQQTPNATKDLSGLFIYLVDDEQSLREALTILFTNLKVKTKAFSSIPTLKRYLSTSTCEQPDFVLSDYQLGHNQIGAQAIQLVRKRFKKEIPGTIMTGNTSKSIHEKILNHGYGLALKPLSRTDLQALLSDVKTTQENS